MRTALAIALLLASCDYDPRGRCASARDCLAGQVCSGGVCHAPGADPANGSPIAVPDAYAVARDTHLIVPEGSGLLANDSDPDGDPLEVEWGPKPANGRVLPFSAKGAFLYVPDPGYAGADTFTYRAFDGSQWSPAATVTITVGP